MSDSVFLADVCTLITKGTTPTTVGSRFTDSGVNFIKSESLSYQGNIDKGKFAFIDAATHSMLKRSQIFQRDILYSIAGANLGKCGMATADMLPANTNQAVAIIRVDPSKASPEFVSYVLRDTSFVQRVLNGVAQSAQPNVNLGDIGRFRLPKLPHEVQVRIAALLKGLDDKIELNRRMNETLEAMAQAIFRDWFMDFGPTRRKRDGATDPVVIMGGLVQDAKRARALADLFPATLGDNGLPEEWKPNVASAVVEFNPKEPLRKGTLAFYSDMSSLPTSGSIAELPVEREYSSGMRFRNGDALLARITPCLENGKAAFVDFLPDEDAVGWGSTEFYVLRSRDGVPAELAYLLVRHPEFRAVAIASMTGTSGRQRAQVDRLEEFPFVEAPKDVMATFGTLVEPMFDKISANGKENRTLAATRDLLLPKLISDEIRLSDAAEMSEAAQ